VDARSQLTPGDARAFLGLPAGYAPPEQALLERDARRIVLETLRLDHELSHLAAQGLQLSPIWEEKDGLAHVRLAVMPTAFRRRFFDGDEAREALEDGELVRIACELVTWIVDDPVGGTFALEDTHRVWFDAEAPSRSLKVPYRGHEKVLSLLVADGVRKADAGFTTLEWLASLGLPIEESREDDDPAPDAIRASMAELSAAMRAEETAWLARAFGRG
jgi:hypothetical protein